MKLDESMPEWMSELSAVSTPAELRGLGQILQSNRVSNYRLVDYVCPRAHRLAEVLDVPEGRLLLLHGLHIIEGMPGTEEDAWQMFTEGGIRRRPRAKSEAVRLADLDPWRHSHLDGGVAVRCRCGRHSMDLWRAFDDIAARTRRVVLSRVAQRM